MKTLRLKIKENKCYACHIIMRHRIEKTVQLGRDSGPKQLYRSENLSTELYRAVFPDSILMACQLQVSS